MEDNQTLLMLVLKHHYRDRPNILDEALQVIKEYSSKEGNEQEYDKTLHILQEMMNDLPANILLYFLTMVPLPEEDEQNKSDLLEIIKKSQSSICGNIRPILVDYLNRKVPPLVPIQNQPNPSRASDKEEENIIVDDSPDSEEEDEGNKENSSPEDEAKDPDFVKPTRTIRSRQRKTLPKSKPEPSCKSLLDLCSEYIVQNEQYLKKKYKKRKDEAWKMVYCNKYTGKDLNMCYDVIRDINRKEKWLRAIENDEITNEILAEVYGDSEIFIRERNLVQELNEDPFIVSAKLQSALNYYTKHC